MLCEVEATVFLSTYDLKQDHSKAENIRFYRKYAFHCILGSHVSAVLRKALITIYTSQIK